MIDRKVAPQIAEEWESPVLPFVKHELSNGIPCYFIDSGSSELLKIEWIFEAGASASSKYLVPAFTADMLKEGTDFRDSAGLADAFDNYGAFFGIDFSQDHSVISLYCLTKNLDQVLPLIKEVLSNSNFPEKELELNKENSKQKLALSNEKVAYLSRQVFMQNLFGDNSTYGHIETNTDIENVKRTDLLEFYKEFYTVENCRIIISGKIPGSFDQKLNSHFGSDNWNKENTKDQTGITQNIKEFQLKQKVLAEKPAALQSSIRIGRKVINKHHPDIHNLVILNTLLGGYFGSRLMSNIREDKGYTYGIGSGIAHLKHGSFMSIATEVGADVCDSAINEVYFEINRLLQEPVSKEELKTVTNYLAGTFLRSMDGPFEMAEKFKSLLIWDLDLSYYEMYLSSLKTVNPELILSTANKYLTGDNWLEVVAGPGKV